MSGSLSSLILIAVVWLLLLAPLFLRKQSPVRRTSKALSETRVLHEGGAEISRPRKRPLPAESLYHADVDDDIELVEAEPEQVIIDDTGRDVPGIIEGEVVGYRPLDEEDTGEFAPVDPLASDTEAVEDSAFVVDTEVGEEAEDADDVDDTDDADVTDEAGLDENDQDRRRFSDVPAAYLRGGDIDVTVGTDEQYEADAQVGGDDESSDDFLDDEYGDGELTAEELDYAAARRGRGFYDPEASQRLVERRQMRRKRVLSVLAALCVVSVVAAVILGGAVWSAVVVMVALSGVYLYYLRRQVVEEARLRRRRIARMRRARLGVRNTDDRELGVPDRLLRPGAVVLESDDADPEFADLAYADYPAYSGYADDDGYDGYGGYDDHADTHIRAV
ncbi:gephyrin-like molybdotransferase receptor GlpR [Corynebacterium sp.]|uniref:divisome protein SepX/GlpR n=1 Tax=Corynebacterium sp. TaxID=1720 RepID=UPI0028AFDB53|nr:gephyrin-like molybdotransferase receptor GlpR [Corynebacterium sp.]